MAGWVSYRVSEAETVNETVLPTATAAATAAVIATATVLSGYNTSQPFTPRETCYNDNTTYICGHACDVVTKLTRQEG
eukprot:6670825-Pyramimonas_sp.AAC.1